MPSGIEKFKNNKLTLQVEGSDPLVSVAPDIDWRMDLNFNMVGSTVLQVSGTIQGKAFPAYESFIQDEGGTKAFLHTYAAPNRLELGPELLNPLYDYKRKVSFRFELNSKGNIQTWYVRDANGNVLSIYTYGDPEVNSGQLSQIEVDLYGTSRLAMTTLATNVQDQSPSEVTSMTGLGYGKNITFIRGKKTFELTNHLGNVIATVSDKKTGISLNNSAVDSYNPVITSAQEYYPFGMLMPGRGGHIGAGKNVAGSTVIIAGDTISLTLTVTQRTNNLPETYMATQIISFEEEFTSGSADNFTTLLVDQSNTDPGTENGISYGIPSKGYRYGFNGKGNDNDEKGEGNEQDYGMRIYDPRVARFLSVDPIANKYPQLTPYQFASNRPIDGIDQGGLEYVTYLINIDLDKGVMHPSLSWYNPKQHNEHGGKGRSGKGVQYIITITGTDAKSNTKFSDEIRRFVERNAGATIFNFQADYGNYFGSTSLYKVDKYGEFTKEYDYALPPVDQVDYLAMLHDQGYDRVNSTGKKGLYDDFGTTPYDEAALAGWKDLYNNYKIGDKDPFNGQPISSEEMSLAYNGIIAFKSTISDKKIKIETFMHKNYAQTMYMATEQAYQVFLGRYMEKDSDGNWRRKKGMLHKEKDPADKTKKIWVPNKK